MVAIAQDAWLQKYVESGWERPEDARVPAAEGAAEGQFGVIVVASEIIIHHPLFVSYEESRMKCTERGGVKVD